MAMGLLTKYTRVGEVSKRTKITLRFNDAIKNSSQTWGFNCDW